MDERYETAQVALASVSVSLSFCPAYQMKPVVICCHIFVILSRGCPLSPGAEQRNHVLITATFLRRPAARCTKAPMQPLVVGQDHVSYIRGCQHFRGVTAWHFHRAVP